jgi:hypothetical protein
MQTNFYAKVKMMWNTLLSKFKRHTRRKRYHEVIEIVGSGFTIMPDHMIEQYKTKNKRDD